MAPRERDADPAKHKAVELDEALIRRILSRPLNLYQQTERRPTGHRENQHGATRARQTLDPTLPPDRASESRQMTRQILFQAE